MTNKTAATRYARALLDVAVKEKADLEAIERDLAAFADLFTAHPALAKVMLNPAVPVPRKRAAMAELVSRMAMPPILAKLVTMLAETTAMQLVCFRLAQLQEAGTMSGPMASLAKLHNVRKAKLVCSEARDILGGNGLLLDYHVARHLTDVEIVATYEGTDTIQSLIVGRDLTGISAFT